MQMKLDQASHELVSFVFRSNRKKSPGNWFCLLFESRPLGAAYSNVHTDG